MSRRRRNAGADSSDKDPELAVGERGQLIFNSEPVREALGNSLEAVDDRRVERGVWECLEWAIYRTNVVGCQTFITGSKSTPQSKSDG